MDVSNDCLIELNKAAAFSGVDLFLVCGGSVILLQMIEYFSRTDERVIFLLPDKFIYVDNEPGSKFNAININHNTPYSVAASTKSKIFVAGIDEIADEQFRHLIRELKINHIVVPFAELADSTEYGHRYAYHWIGELRAELPIGIRLSALFTYPCGDYSYFSKIFGSSDVTVVDVSEKFDFNSIKVSTEKEKFNSIQSAVNSFNGNTAVIFTNRREAELFIRIIKKNNTNVLYLNGSLDCRNKKRIMTDFMLTGSLLVATKSVVPYSLLYKSDNVIYCGVPYSHAFAGRCAAFSHNNVLTCYFCHSDLETNIKAIKHFAEIVPEEEKIDFLAGYLEKLLDVKNYLYTIK